MDEYISQSASIAGGGQLPVLAAIALILGLGKGGVPGLATVATAATVLTAPLNSMGYAVSLQVPILTMIDIYAAWLHSSNLDWPSVKLLLPASFVGMAIGQYLDRRVSDATARVLVGCVLLGILALRTWKPVLEFLFPAATRARAAAAAGKESDNEEEEDEEKEGSAVGTRDIEGGTSDASKKRRSKRGGPLHDVGWACSVGLVGGAATMLTNSMGPLLNVYLLSVRELPPRSYVGTRAAFFCVLNLGKLPMRFVAGTLGWSMMPLAVGLGVISVAGVSLAKPILTRMNEALFVKLELSVVAFAGLRLCWMGLHD